MNRPQHAVWTITKVLLCIILAIAGLAVFAFTACGVAFFGMSMINGASGLGIAALGFGCALAGGFVLWAIVAAFLQVIRGS